MRPVSKVAQVAQKLRTMGFTDIALARQSARRLHQRGVHVEPSTLYGNTAWFKTYRDARKHGTRIKVEVRISSGTDVSAIEETEDVIRTIVPEVTLVIAPSGRMLTATWIEAK